MMAIALEPLFHEGHCYAAELEDDAVVTLLRDGLPAGAGRWYRKKIVDAPETVPPVVLVWLSQQIRTTLLQTRVSRQETKRSRPSKREVHELFQYIGLPDVPQGCRRWARVRMRQVYSVFVMPGNEALVFRNWMMIGKGQWSSKRQMIVGYVGDKVPSAVLAQLNRQLTTPDM